MKPDRVLVAPVQRRRALLASASAAVLAWAGSALAAPAQRGDRVAWPAVTLLDGRIVSADSLHDTATVVVFFSTTCVYCRRHNRHIETLLQATRGRGLQVIGAAHDRDPGLVRQYLAGHGWHFDTTLDVQPLHAALSERRITPLTCVIDRQGLLRAIIPGEMFEDDVLELARLARP